jgi:hypothetical protein
LHAVVVYKDIIYGESVWKWNQPPPETHNTSASESPVIGKKLDIMIPDSQNAEFMSPVNNHDDGIN